MIGSVAIQRLLEAAILLKLERGTRGSDAQSSDAPKPLSSSIATQQPASQPPGARGAHFTQASTWSNAPVIPAEVPVATAAASALREAAVAPLAYRETVSDAAPTGARAPEQMPVGINAVPAPIQYAHAELTLALLRMKPGVSAVDMPTPAIGQFAGAALTQEQREQFATERQTKIIALICGSAVLLATFAVLIFG